MAKLKIFLVLHSKTYRLHLHSQCLKKRGTWGLDTERQV